jgi:hypothetical protein
MAPFYPAANRHTALTQSSPKNRFVQVQADQPPEQHVVLQLLHQHALAAHGVQNL